MKTVLDACCSSRMMWFDRNDERAVFMDKRELTETLCDGRILEVKPDVVADFTDMPFAEESFRLVVFDPPHMTSLGEKSWLAKKYGRLFGHWESEISEGFRECFRVLKPGGVLIFKWNDVDVPQDRVLALCPQKPLFGHTTRVGAGETVWFTFIKDD